LGIVRFALRWPYTFYVAALLILFLGVTAFRSMPADIFPEIDIPVVTVIWQESGLSTQEMEQRITTYSEYSISPRRGYLHGRLVRHDVDQRVILGNRGADRHVPADNLRVIRIR
jgi:AcrB/AcrD/AcrF family